ncbi:MAG: hypothetical protein WA811_01960 [Candidatus Sulfotelmatobacter sp.]
MNTLRIAVSCALVGWMAADARAQLGTYGAPDPISWNQDAAPAGYVPMVATRTTYVSTADGSVSTQNAPASDNSGLGTAIELLELQLEGKKRSSAADFIRGYRPATGEKLGS